MQENATLLHIPETLRHKHTLTDTAELLLLLLLSRLCSIVLLRPRDDASSSSYKRCLELTNQIFETFHEITLRSPGTSVTQAWHSRSQRAPAATWSKPVEWWCLRVRRLPVSSVTRQPPWAWRTPFDRPRGTRDSRTRDKNRDRMGEREPLDVYSDWQPPARSARHGWHLSNWFARFTTSGSTEPSIQVGLARGLAPPARRIGRPRRHASAERARARSLASS